MANLFAADGAVSPTRATAPAQDARQRVDPVTAVALPAANRRGCWIVNRSDRAGSSKPPVPRFPDFRNPTETLGRAHLRRVRTKVVTGRRGYRSMYWCKRIFCTGQLGSFVRVLPQWPQHRRSPQTDRSSHWVAAASSGKHSRISMMDGSRMSNSPRYDSILGLGIGITPSLRWLFPNISPRAAQASRRISTSSRRNVVHVISASPGGGGSVGGGTRPIGPTIKLPPTPSKTTDMGTVRGRRRGTGAGSKYNPSEQSSTTASFAGWNSRSGAAASMLATTKSSSYPARRERDEAERDASRAAGLDAGGFAAGCARCRRPVRRCAPCSA